MQRESGWTLLETLIVISLLALLIAVLVPSLSNSRAIAKRAACAAGMHNIHQGLWTYAAENRSVLPPFAFSDYHGNLPLSGHWGGVPKATDPEAFGRMGVESVNLWALVLSRQVDGRQLICAGASGDLMSGAASHFPYTPKYSTYCLRFPTSMDLFATAELAYKGDRTLLGIYAVAAGGQAYHLGQNYPIVPQVRVDRRYRTTILGFTCGDGDYDVAEEALLSDAFWRQDASVPAAGSPRQSLAVKASWCHGRRFNVLYGGGSVRLVDDSGVVRANSIPPGGALADDHVHYATYAERIWQFFDGRL